MAKYGEEKDEHEKSENAQGLLVERREMSSFLAESKPLDSSKYGYHNIRLVRT